MERPDTSRHRIGSTRTLQDVGFLLHSSSFEETGLHFFSIYNPCEPTVFRSATDVQSRGTFWIKSHSYSLYEMLDGDKNREQSNLRGGIGCSVVPRSLRPSSPAEPRGWDRPQSTPMGAHLSTAQLPRSICAPTSICIYCTSGKAQADVGSRRDIGTNLDTSTM